MGSKGGRPTEFTTEAALAIVAAVRSGSTRSDAARAAGVSPSALYRWLALGRASDARFKAFADQVATAGENFRLARSRARMVRLGVPRRPRAE
jgi:transposase-like protein